MQNIYDTAILGAGASGLMCAGLLQNKKTIIIEGSKRPGLKVLASGGGHCNFSNQNISKDFYLSQNPMFCMSALAQFTTKNIVQLFYAHKIPFETRPTGQLFAFNSAAVLTMLEDDARAAGAQFAFDNTISAVCKNGDIFEIKTNRQVFFAKNVVCALGGISYPKLGASDAAFKIARGFGLGVTPLYPALTGIIFDDTLKARFAPLAGLSLKAKITCQKKSFEDDILFTHEGLSGPAVFKLSLYGLSGKEVKINFCPAQNAAEFLEQNKNGKKTLSSLLPQLTAARLPAALFGEETLKRRIADISAKDLNQIVNTLEAFTFTPAGVNGYDKAEITAGGVDTKQISSKTMQANGIGGLYFIGEALDVSGQLGGYNLHWAWASAAAAAKAINANNF